MGSHFKRLDMSKRHYYLTYLVLCFHYSTTIRTYIFAHFRWQTENQPQSEHLFSPFNHTQFMSINLTEIIFKNFWRKKYLPTFHKFWPVVCHKNCSLCGWKIVRFVVVVRFVGTTTIKIESKYFDACKAVSSIFGLIIMEPFVIVKPRGLKWTHMRFRLEGLVGLISFRQVTQIPKC